MATFNGYSNAPARRAPVRSISPASGAALGADFEAGRWQKVTITALELSSGMEPLITLKYKGSALRHVVYDGDGFTPLFALYSTKVGNVFTILPAGGWHREPERLWVGEAVEAAT